MFHCGISNWKSLLASHLYHSVKHIISGQLNRNTGFLFCVMCLAGASVHFYHVLPNLLLYKTADLLVPSLWPMLGCAFAAGRISKLHCGDNLALYHGGEVDMESCTAAFHRQATAVARCNIMSKVKHFSSTSASKLFWMVPNWLQKHQTTEKIVCFSGNKWRYFSDNRTFWWKIVRFFTNFIFQVKTPNGVESSDVAINISESELCLTEHECSHFLPWWCS